MANTTTVSGNFVEITGLDTDWTFSTDLPTVLQPGIRVRSIQFNPSGPDDVMIVHDGSVDGPAVFHVKCDTVYDQRIKYFNPPVPMRPVIDYSDNTLSNAANAKVIIEIV